MFEAYRTDYQNDASETLEVWIERAPPIYQAQEAWGNRNYRVAKVGFRQTNTHMLWLKEADLSVEVRDAITSGIRQHEGRNEYIQLDTFIPGPSLIVYNTFQSIGD